MYRDVVITGLGSISPIGHDTAEFWDSLQNGRCGVRPLSNLATTWLNTPIAAEVQNFNPEEYLSTKELLLFDRFSQFAYVAAREAISDAGLTESEIGPAAIILGNSCGAEKTYDEGYQRLYIDRKSRVHPLTVPKAMQSAAASQISMKFGIHGPVFIVSSACSSSAHATIQAALMIKSGLVDVAITGGTEAPFSIGLVKAWEGLKVLSHDTCRPFSENRSGLVMGEGAGIVVIESKDHAEKRGADIYAKLSGFGMSSDAGHITAPSLEGASMAMTSALIDAGLSPSDVDYINAHGTGTLLNDLTETEAINKVFGEHARRVPVSSTKSMHGHPLGAAGGLELVATVCAINEGVLPPTANFTKPGEGCNLDYIPNEAREKKINTAISNSFAFGGLNSVLVVQSYK